jgi:hypothetical protein
MPKITATATTTAIIVTVIGEVKVALDVGLPISRRVPVKAGARELCRYG